MKASIPMEGLAPRLSKGAVSHKHTPFESGGYLY